MLNESEMEESVEESVEEPVEEAVEEPVKVVPVAPVFPAVVVEHEQKHEAAVAYDEPVTSVVAWCRNRAVYPGDFAVQCSDAVERAYQALKA